MNYVVTGASGFIGRALTKHLALAGHKVTGIDLLPSENTGEFIALDFRDPQIKCLIDDETTVIHLAAMSNNKEFDKDPTRSIDVNILGTQILMSYANEKNAAHFIFASSEWVYPDGYDDSEVNEDFNINLASLKSSYGQSKLISEIFISKYSCVPTSILRFGITYGSRIQPQSALEDLTKKYVRSEPVELRSPGSARRFIHVEDLVDGLASIAQSNPRPGIEIFNLCGDKLISLKMVVRELEVKFQSRSEIALGIEQASIRNPSNEKFCKQFNWRPRISLSKGLESLISFYVIQG